MDVLAPLLISLPMWLVLLIGIVYGVMMLRVHRTVSMLAILSLSGFLALDLMGTLVWTSYEWFVAARGGAGVSVWITNGFFGLQTLMHTGFLGIGIAAAARNRGGSDAGE